MLFKRLDYLGKPNGGDAAKEPILTVPVMRCVKDNTDALTSLSAMTTFWIVGFDVD